LSFIYFMSLKNIILGIAIVVLTIFVTINGISVFYPIQQYEDFCGDVKTQEVIQTQERCEEIGGKWSVYEAVKPVEGAEGFCDRDFTCRQNYDDAREERAKKIFYVALPFGILILLIGGFLFHLEAVGAGLMGGGVGTLVYGAGSYWQYGGELFRFIISLLGLVAVIFLAYWFNKKFGKPVKNKKK